MKTKINVHKLDIDNDKKKFYTFKEYSLDINKMTIEHYSSHRMINGAINTFIVNNISRLVYPLISIAKLFSVNKEIYSKLELSYDPTTFELRQYADIANTKCTSININIEDFIGKIASKIATRHSVNIPTDMFSYFESHEKPNINIFGLRAIRLIVNNLKITPKFIINMCYNNAPINVQTSVNQIIPSPRKMIIPVLIGYKEFSIGFDVLFHSIVNIFFYHNSCWGLVNRMGSDMFVDQIYETMFNVLCEMLNIELMPRTYNNFLSVTIGCDPEFEIYQTKKISINKKIIDFNSGIVSADMILSSRYRCGKIGVDGHTSILEIRPGPHDNPKNMAIEIEELFTKIQKILQTKWKTYESNHYETELAVVSGGGRLNPTGAHIHFGSKIFSMISEDGYLIPFGKMLDIFLYRPIRKHLNGSCRAWGNIPSIVSSKTSENTIKLIKEIKTPTDQYNFSHNYEIESSFRKQAHGLEYRSLPSFFIDKTFTYLVFKIAHEIAKLFQKSLLSGAILEFNNPPILVDYERFLTKQEAILFFQYLKKCSTKLIDNVFDNWNIQSKPSRNVYSCSFVFSIFSGEVLQSKIQKTLNNLCKLLKCNLNIMTCPNEGSFTSTLIMPILIPTDNMLLAFNSTYFNGNTIVRRTIINMLTYIQTEISTMLPRNTRRIIIITPKITMRNDEKMLILILITGIASHLNPFNKNILYDLLKKLCVPKIFNKNIEYITQMLNKDMDMVPITSIQRAICSDIFTKENGLSLYNGVIRKDINFYTLTKEMELSQSL